LRLEPAFDRTRRYAPSSWRAAVATRRFYRTGTVTAAAAGRVHALNVGSRTRCLLPASTYGSRAISKASGAKRLVARSCWVQPPGVRHRAVGWSEDCQLFEIIVPAGHALGPVESQRLADEVASELERLKPAEIA